MTRRPLLLSASFLVLLTSLSVAVADPPNITAFGSSVRQQTKYGTYTSETATITIYGDYGLFPPQIGGWPDLMPAFVTVRAFVFSGGQWNQYATWDDQSYQVNNNGQHAYYGPYSFPPYTNQTPFAPGTSIPPHSFRFTTYKYLPNGRTFVDSTDAVTVLP